MRFTKKNKRARYGYKYIAPNRFDNFGKGCNKLGQLEDILEVHNIETVKELNSLLSYVKQIKNIQKELGIDLITLFKALKNGIWIYDTNGIKMFTGHFQNGLVFNYCSQPSIQYVDRLFYLNDYGKTWALTKEELQ